MVDGLKSRPLVFDCGIDRISYREDGIEGEGLPSSDQILPSEDGIRPLLDSVIHAAQLEDGIRGYLMPEVRNRDLLRPTAYGVATQEICRQLRDAARSDPAAGPALERLAALLVEQQGLRDLLAVYRSALFRA